MPAPPRSTIPPRPSMPTDADQARSEYQASSTQVLEDDYDEQLEAWAEQHVQPERLAKWGPLDTSSNPLAGDSRQLATPGHYGVRPTWRHPDPFAAGLIDPGGALDQAGYHTGMQTVEYFVIGMGDYFVRMGVSSDGARLTVRQVNPSNVWVRTDLDEPTRILELWELRLFWSALTDAYIWAWEQFILDGADGPVHQIVEALTDGSVGDDLSGMFLRHPSSTPEAPVFGRVTGDDYPWVEDGGNGQPRVPYVSYHVAHGGSFWNQYIMRGAHRGTLQASLYASYAGRCALDATGGMVFTAGIKIPGVTSAPSADGATAVQSVTGEPGTIYECALASEDATPWLQVVGPGANLPIVADFAVEYSNRISRRLGLSSSDPTRMAANPASGISLFISRQDKREFGAKTEPQFRASDLDAVKLAAIVLRAGTGVEYPETGYTITYAAIPKSPQEEKDQRDGLEWRASQGLISKAQQFQILNPGTTDADARRAIADAAISDAMIDADISARLEAAGLAGEAQAAGPPVTVDTTVMTINERRAIDGLGPLPDGNAVYMPSNLIPAIEAD